MQILCVATHLCPSSMREREKRMARAAVIGKIKMRKLFELDCAETDAKR